MLETIAAMRTLTAIEVFGVVLCGVGLVYVALQWRRWRGSSTGRKRQAAPPNVTGAATNEWVEHSLAPPDIAPAGGSADGLSAKPNPELAGKLRSGREAGRMTEDEIAQQHMGRRGSPGEPAMAKTLPENITQIPKPLDPGHTA
jgi:hypothetical protein